jgi:hypothetical protein
MKHFVYKYVLEVSWKFQDRSDKHIFQVGTYQNLEDLGGLEMIEISFKSFPASLSSSLTPVIVIPFLAGFPTSSRNILTKNLKSSKFIYSNQLTRMML